MIINGGSRCNGAFFARHLMHAEENERVTVGELRGFAHAETVPEAFQEMQDVASGTRVKNFFYHANINTRADEVLTPEQWAQAVDRLEDELHLTGQPRLIIEHEKEGRIHRHVVWSRIDADSMTAITDSHNYRTHEMVATGLEQAFGHNTTARALTRDKETVERPEPRFKGWEDFRAADTGIDPKAMKAELTELWQRADSGQAFAAALEDRGYILTKGDRRDFCVIDAEGDEHSLGRRLAGVKAAEVRARMAEVDREALPTVAEGRALARERRDTAGSADTPAMEPQADREPALAPSLAEPVPAAPVSAFEAILAETVAVARVQAAQDAPGERFARWQGWWETMRQHVAGLSRQAQERFGHYFSRGEPEPPALDHTRDLGPER